MISLGGRLVRATFAPPPSLFRLPPPSVWRRGDEEHAVGGSALLSAKPSRAALTLFVKYAPHSR